MEQIRKIIYYKTYFIDFFDKQPEKVKSKIDQVLYVIAIADRIPKKFFDHIGYSAQTDPFRSLQTDPSF